MTEKNKKSNIDEELSRAETALGAADPAEKLRVAGPAGPVMAGVAIHQGRVSSAQPCGVSLTHQRPNCGPGRVKGGFSERRDHLRGQSQHFLNILFRRFYGIRVLRRSR